MSDGLTVNEIKEQLDNLENAINEAKREDAEISGKISITEETMKDKFGTSSIPQLKSIIAKEEKELEKEEKELITAFTKLKENYDW